MAEERNERDRNREEEQAIWEQLVASFDAEPEDDGSWPDAERLDGGSGGGEAASGDEADGDGDGPGEAGRPFRDMGVNTVRAVVFPSGPVTPPPGPREWEEPDDEDDDHFVPPPPPPLPRLDVTAKFAWLAVLGGPLLLLVYVLLQQEITWWAALLGIGGFLGGFATLVARMKDGDEEDDDPMGGAVV